MKNSRKDWSELCKYLLSVIPFYLCARAKILPQMCGLALPLYVALIYCRANIFLLSPMYIVASLIADSSLGGLALALSPVVVMIVARLIHYKIAKPMRLGLCNVYAFLSTLPLIFVDMYCVSPVFLVISLVIMQIVSCFSIIICYAIFVRTVGHHFSADELCGGVILLATLALGLYDIEIFGFRPFFVVMAFGILYCIFSLPSGGGALCCFAFALGGSLSARSLEIAGGIVAIYFIGKMFGKTNKYFCGVGVFLADVLCGVYFSCFGQYEMLHMIAVAVGVAVYICLPKVVVSKLNVYRETNGSVGAKNMLNRSKQDLSRRLQLVSRVFCEMADAYSRAVSVFPTAENASSALAKELVLYTCASCPNRQNCVNALGRQPSDILETVVISALSTGKATLVDLPNFINSNCCQIPNLLSNCNAIVGEYVAKASHAQEYDADQRLMASQLAGVSNVLLSLGDEVEKSVAIDEEKQDKIVEELSYINVVCNEALVLVNNGVHHISLVVRKEDALKKSILTILKKLFSCSFAQDGAAQSLSEKQCVVNYITAPKYDLSFGICQGAKGGASANGDSASVTRLRSNKIMVGLCDGMGSGEGAQRGSFATLDMIQNFYKAGFDNLKALALVNKLLAITSKDNFTALDMCVINLDSANVDFIKLGGVQSYIRRQDNVEIVNSQALPIGILDEAIPQVSRVILTAEDMVVLVSDGISDALSSSGIKFVIEKIGDINPQAVADEIMKQAKCRGLNDDATVIAFRIFRLV
ncbi:MAG: SpoIIE family protein phosphatase [Clostridia bacterium]